jgi:ABC-type glycerol-3-phosphate transport system permease component
MSVTLTLPQPARRSYRLRWLLTEAGSVMLGIVILIWSLTPVYNMFLIALDPEEGEIEFDGNLWPPEPSLEGFRAVVTQEARYLEDFWHQFGNSLFIGLVTVLLTVLIGSLASFRRASARRGRAPYGLPSLLAQIDARLISSATLNAEIGLLACVSQLVERRRYLRGPRTARHARAC